MHKIELLSRLHDREDFDCGSEQLNLFLRQTARQHADRGISQTFVLVDEAEPKRINGFFSLNICQIKSERLPPDEAKRLPRDVSAVRLGRLAVARQNQREGFGRILMAAAIDKVIEIFRIAGGIGLFVDAKDLHAKRYYEGFGFVALPSNELELFLPCEPFRNSLNP